MSTNEWREVLDRFFGRYGVIMVLLTVLLPSFGWLWPFGLPESLAAKATASSGSSC